MSVRRVVAVALLLSGVAPIGVRAQSPGDAWVTMPSPPRTIKTTFWPMTHQTEIWVRLAPHAADGQPIAAELVFDAIFKGDVTKPGSITLPPTELTVLAQASPMAFYLKTTFKLSTKDGQSFDFAAPGAPFSSSAQCPTCGASSIRTPIDAKTVAALAGSDVITGEVLGMSCQLDRADTTALAAFVKTVMGKG